MLALVLVEAVVKGNIKERSGGGGGGGGGGWHRDDGCNKGWELGRHCAIELLGLVLVVCFFFTFHYKFNNVS